MANSFDFTHLFYAPREVFAKHDQTLHSGFPLYRIAGHSGQVHRLEIAPGGLQRLYQIGTDEALKRAIFDPEYCISETFNSKYNISGPPLYRNLVVPFTF